MTIRAQTCPGAERSYSRTRASADLVRRQFIDLTYEIPEGAPKDVLHAWNVADKALVDFTSALERAQGSDS